MKKIKSLAALTILPTLMMTSCGRTSNHSLFETAIGSVEGETSIDATLYNKRGTSTAEVAYSSSSEADSEASSEETSKADVIDEAVDFVQGVGQTKPRYVWAKMADAYSDDVVNEYYYIYAEKDAESKNSSAGYAYDDITVSQYYTDTETKHAVAAKFNVNCAGMATKFEAAPYVSEVTLYQMNGYLGNSVTASYEYKLSADASKASDPLVDGDYSQWIHRFGWKDGKITQAHKVTIDYTEHSLNSARDNPYGFEYYVVEGDNLSALHDAIGESFEYYDALSAKSWKLGDAAYDWASPITEDITISCEEQF